ncbi:UDP-glucose dehydrogenase family protein [Paenibacillus roseipurpureus]|uniref:UDP-glucose 6-dehydrogenase n=1 Tax=Paenibacillus roseopurpureus TaxID=2918901 RepID=A0AA96RHT9_9BACL|nr:UDP-glucose/GDP-mannose dehydrogenase family protein [Paenibacillus sp. MBLB1832]WNR42080.1 UDP-glucose/GDP-mannose dehydrogenase family protein [Paenibacillus sp. MBLB1832]
MRITIVGTGYVGLVAAVCLAKQGHQVTAVDREPVIRGLRAGVLGIWEPGLEELFADGRASGNLRWETDVVRASLDAEALMLAVGTPTRPDGHTDLSQLHEVLAKFMHHGDCPPLIIVKSTVPVGTCDELEVSLRETGLRTEIVSNPEFLRQGSAIQDFMYPDRIVVGCQSPYAEAELRHLYARIDAPVQVCDRRSAELIKYAANTFLATKISFANMMSDLCEGYGADIRQVMAGVGSDRRIGPHFLQAGVGYGGSCFSKDLQSLLTSGKLVGLSLPMLEATAHINEQRIPRFIAKLISCWGNLQGKRLAVLGISFKPNTNDVRDAPFLTLLKQCQLHGIAVQAYDPVVQHVPYDGVHVADSAYTASVGADAIMILTEWPQFVSLDWARMAQGMRQPIMLDGRNLLPNKAVERFLEHDAAVYIPVGRSVVSCWGD